MGPLVEELLHQAADILGVERDGRLARWIEGVLFSCHANAANAMPSNHNLPWCDPHGASTPTEMWKQVIKILDEFRCKARECCRNLRHFPPNGMRNESVAKWLERRTI